MKKIGEQDIEAPKLPPCHFCLSSPKRKELMILWQNSLFSFGPDYHPLNFGHWMIFPHSHYLSSSENTDEEMKMMEKLVSEFQEFLEKVYKCKTVLYEHGSTKNSIYKAKRGSRSVIHAHMHILCVPEGLKVIDEVKKEENMKITEIKNMKEIQGKYVGEPYYFYKDMDGKNYIFEWIDKGKSQTQYLRCVISKLMGNPEKGNWKMASKEVLENFNVDVKKEFKRIKEIEFSSNIK